MFHLPLAAAALCVMSSLSLVPSAFARPVAEKVTAQVVRTSVDEALEALDRPESRARIARLLGSPEIQRSLRDLTAAVVAGAADGLNAKAMSRGAVDGALSAALSGRNAAPLAALAERIGRGAAAGAAQGIEESLGRALATILVRDLGPAVGTVLARDILPSVGRGLSQPEMRGALTDLSQQLAADLVAGSAQGLDAQRQKSEAAGAPDAVRVFGRTVGAGVALGLAAALGLAGLLVAVMVLLVRSQRQQRALFRTLSAQGPEAAGAR